MEIIQDIHLAQKQVLAPALRQSLEILGMNNQQLDEFIENQQLENPVLDRGESAAFSEQWNSFTAQCHASGRKKNTNSCEDILYSDIPAEQPETLEKYLTEQLVAGKMTDMEYRLAVYMIRGIDSNGYLGATLQDICKATGAGLRQAERCLAIIQGMEPAGVGARNLEECLQLQLRRSGLLDRDLEELIAHHLRDVANCHINKITREMHLSRARTEKLIGILKTLNPRPASCIEESEIQYIIPDVIVKKEEDGLKISLNDRWMQPPALNGYYLSLAASCDDPELKSYLNEKIFQAKFVLSNIERRRNTVISVMRIILEQQYNFFRSGGSLAPLSMQFAASALGVHESTICRAVKDKYVQCGNGTFPMRAFFVRRVCRESGSEGKEEVSNSGIKEVIDGIVQKENKQSPLSDADISERLKDMGICISRRTVAKYREEMGIPNAFVRKSLGKDGPSQEDPLCEESSVLTILPRMSQKNSGKAQKAAQYGRT
ncbi:RNA polymerase sigma-54 factor [Caproiciproducens sp. NJN-50]|uniref:RNA polymerase factor sigma-54 n=1 Tax=Acutalibacteraceae TaxID=3082771 RepID=UPI000FFE2A95|nr:MULTISPECIES: RNA polymerase factor sigma-54 [Acutalibacteraceae]QAT48836.1 RNA polymerase sigma-54 factor [Caproiciproducens sp. NJN-50]